jgi:hypothetical protein
MNSVKNSKDKENYSQNTQQKMNESSAIMGNHSKKIHRYSLKMKNNKKSEKMLKNAKNAKNVKKNNKRNLAFITHI